MTKHTLSLHLNDDRKKRLDALIAHSEYEGHGSQSEFLRALIDKTAADHPEIDYEHPHASIEEEEWKYHPIEHEGLLTQDQVREILNTEKAPAIDPGHCPPTWTPRDKSDKAVLMAAHYRYHYHITGNNTISDEVSEKEVRNKAIKDVEGEIVASKRRNEYHKMISRVLETYGENPSNIIIIDEILVKEWVNNMKKLTRKSDVPHHFLNQQIEQGQEIKQHLSESEEDKLLIEVKSVIDKLQQEK